MLKIFFSPENTDTACGMFTLPHIISLAMCLALVGACVYFSKSLSDGTIKRITFILAITFTVMEIIKIIYKLCLGYTEYLDYYLPISFCSLFIPSLWLCACCKGAPYRIGASFIRFGCVVGGLAFLIVPATSLMMHPIYHYLSIHSMLFHSAMVYMGVVFILRREVPVTKSSFLTYCSFVLATCVVAISLNLITGSNLMLLSFPVNIPIALLNSIASKIPALYTAGASVAYVFIPFGIMMLVELISKKLTKKASVS